MVCKNKENFNFEIKSIEMNDIEGYRKILDDVAKERKFLSFFEAPSYAMTQEFVEHNIQHGWPHLLGLVNNTIVAWCDISSLDRPIFEHVGTLGVGVLKEYRHLGIGSKLIKEAINAAMLKGLTRIELTVRESNCNAITLYKSLGFEVEGRHVNAVRVDGIYDHHISMAKLI